MFSKEILFFKFALKFCPINSKNEENVSDSKIWFTLSEIFKYTPYPRKKTKNKKKKHKTKKKTKKKKQQKKQTNKQTKSTHVCNSVLLVQIVGTP